MRTFEVLDKCIQRCPQPAMGEIVLLKHFAMVRRPGKLSAGPDSWVGISRAVFAA